MSQAAMRGVPVVLQDAATTGTGDSVAVPYSHERHIFIFKGSGTISGGAISIEESDDPDYAGTWSVIQAVNASDVTGGAEKIIHVSSLIRAVRARFTSDATGGGTVTVSYVGA